MPIIFRHMIYVTEIPFLKPYNRTPTCGKPRRNVGKGLILLMLSPTGRPRNGLFPIAEKHGCNVTIVTGTH